MKIVFLDAETLGNDILTDEFLKFGEVVVHKKTAAEEVTAHLSDANVAILNKVKITSSHLEKNNDLKLICITATGFDNVDLDACRQHGVAVCNVVGYSTQSVAQVTVAMALSLITRLEEYQRFVRDGSYTRRGIANCLTPVYHEILGKTWGIVGYGNIGRQVGRVAEALGCKVLVYKRTPIAGVECVDFDTICQKSDILSLHTPLNPSTRHLLDQEHIDMLKKNAIVINVARGAVADETALAKAIENRRIGGLGVDVYSAEPMAEDHPFQSIKSYPNVCLTPHMAWGAYETRMRLLNEVVENIEAFLKGVRKNRVV